MSQQRDRPYGNSNFLVDFGDGKAGTVAGGFSEVVFPVFHADPTRALELAVPETTQPEALAPSTSERLLLKRGFIGSLDLYAWWNKARHGRAPKRRTLHVRLLGEDHETVVATWRFRGARPISLSYSPLRATDSGIVIETVELAFERMEMI